MPSQYGAVETEGLLDRFHRNLHAGLIIENKTSEPRDLLMTERTTLSWIRFSTVLALGCCSVMLNYRFDTDSSDDGDNGDGGAGSSHSAAKLTIGALFAALSLFCLIIPGYNYFKAVRNYATEKIETAGSGPVFVLVACSVLLLLGVNITLFAKGDFS
ncbi:unnamed protein product [Kuraishia capsulata CBS 1993]|uniref:DUF202 domain-containing protein n=1 Tax=Kuraishia capsulata CBS 1993 TaxID=1382522 RepID=W6MM29_9ASCO|nr:uncharacterized protein KUCA_T00003539001 [Kuraishia capsulata CBS 1993]CDK27561.1 unnamed protein product [Kuraishia capsulata CBS 1993]